MALSKYNFKRVNRYIQEKKNAKNTSIKILIFYLKMFHPSEDWLPALPRQTVDDSSVSINIEFSMDRLNIESVNESYLPDHDDHESMTKF